MELSREDKVALARKKLQRFQQNKKDKKTKTEEEEATVVAVSLDDSTDKLVAVVNAPTDKATDATDDGPPATEDNGLDALVLSPASTSSSVSV